MEQPKSITMEIDLRKLPMAFITNIKSAATGITKRVVCVPIDDNYIVEDGFVTNSGQQVRTAKLRVRAQAVSDEERAAYADKYGKEKKQDWNLWLDMSKEAREALAQRDPAKAARLDYRSDNFDRELQRQLLPSVGVGYNRVSQPLPDETAPTVQMEQQEGDDDLPF